MALSGTSNKVFGAKNAFRIRIYWTATQNTSGNSSSVTADLFLESIVSWGQINDATSSTTDITINGNKKSFSVVAPLSGNQSRKLGSHTVTVPHNSDGTKTFSISGSHYVDVTYSGSFLGTQKTSGTYTLNTIPRASTARINKSSADIGTSVRITIGKASPGFTHTLNYNWLGNSGNIVTKTSSSTVDWTIPTSFYAILKNATSGGGTIYCDTYSGNTKIGVVSLKLTATVPGSVVPTFSSVSITDGNTAINSLVGASTFVQELSNIKLTLNGASGSQSSTIKSYTINFNGKNYSSNVANVGSISKSGTVTGSAYVTDSRGRRSASRGISINLLPYANPTISIADISRTEGGIGENVVVKRTGRISGLGGKNKSLVYLDYKETGAPTWISIGAMTATGALGVEAFNLTQTTTGNLFKKAKSYEFRINVNDSLTYTTATPTISTASVTMSLGKEGVGVGKLWQKGALDINGNVYSEGRIYANGGIEISGNSFALPEGEGFGGVQLNNSDIMGANGVFFNDVSQDSNGEGLLFLKSGKPVGSLNRDDYDNLLARDGLLRFNGSTVMGDDTGWVKVLLRNGATGRGGNIPDCRKVVVGQTTFVLMRGSLANVLKDSTVYAKLPFTIPNAFTMINAGSDTSGDGTFISWDIGTSGDITFRWRSNHDNYATMWCPLDCAWIV